MLNVVAIMGRLARDPEMRQTTTGKNVASFRIACDRGRRDANGQSVAEDVYKRQLPRPFAPAPHDRLL